MPWEIVKRKDSLHGADQPYISILMHHIGFNAAFSKLAELDPSKRVTIYADIENRRLGFEFHADDREDSLALAYQSGSKKGAKRRSMMCSGRGVYSQYDWVRSVANLSSKKARRFTPKREGKRWVIQLCPAFEIRKARESKDIPSDAVGIYRYIREEGEIAYIGRGAIKNRLNSPDRKEWDFSVVEYSIVADPDERLKWEGFWLERFREANNGKLPIYNEISGKTRGG
jgi:hypothetical protein